MRYALLLFLFLSVGCGVERPPEFVKSVETKDGVSFTYEGENLGFEDSFDIDVNLIDHVKGSGDMAARANCHYEFLLYDGYKESEYLHSKDLTTTVSFRFICSKPVKYVATVGAFFEPEEG